MCLIAGFGWLACTELFGLAACGHARGGSAGVVISDFSLPPLGQIWREPDEHILWPRQILHDPAACAVFYFVNDANSLSCHNSVAAEADWAQVKVRGPPLAREYSVLGIAALWD